MSRFLGLDAGGSATRWAVCDPAGTIIARGEFPPVTGHLFRPEARAAFLALAARLVELAPTAVVAGITGLTGDSAEARDAADILVTTLHIPPAAIRIEDDLWIGYHAAFRPGEGHAVYAGTGSVGLHIAADGTLHRVGGRGMLIDDAGSAFWIGREGLNLLYRRLDAGDPPGKLALALYAAIGGDTWNAVRAHVYGADSRNAVAQLARAVADAADDPGALAILQQAGRELARLATALATRLGPRPVALLGRAAALHPAILDSMRQAAPALSITRPQTDPALAAARLAASCSRAAPGAG
jgi:glucosamine kinase